MRLGELGEQGLVERIRAKVFHRSDDIIVGIGDDASALKAYSSLVTLITTDAFVEGNHFDLTYFSLEDIGYKVISASVSDIAAMGGMPRYCVISLLAPPSISVGDLDKMIDGMLECCNEFDLELVGGDSVGSAMLAISVTAFGEVEVENMILRSGARPGDAIYVTGDLGGSEAGRIALSTTIDVGEDVAQLVSKRHRTPKARIKEARELVTNHTVHSMIDLSDGLSVDAGHIARESSVKLAIDAGSIPVSPQTGAVAQASSRSPLDLALNGGEDFELLFTAFDLDLDGVSGTPVTRIGEVKEGKGVFLVGIDGTERPLKPGGYEHYR